MNAQVETGIVRDPQSGIILSIPNGVYHDITNQEYHSGPGVSKSQLDDIAISPAVYQWKKSAPVDEEKLTALDMGTALHCLLLEPDEFESRFIIAPEFNRRTTAGKESEKEFLDDCKATGKTVMTFEEGRKLRLMRESVFAHPDARWLLEQDGYSESSIYWTDEETREQCRIRPDRYLKNIPVIFDVKKTADIGRFSTHAEEFRYFVQDAMYSEAYEKTFNERPDFLFLMVSDTIDCGRYPVRVQPLEDEWKLVGFETWHSNLRTYHQCKLNNDWHDMNPISRPYWAKRKAV